MDFESEYSFDKVNDSILLDIFPIVLIIIVIFLLYTVYKKIRRR